MKNTTTFHLLLAILFFSILPLYVGAQETAPLPEEEFFSKLMREKDMNLYIKLLLSSYLDGYVNTETFVIWTGV